MTQHLKMFFAAILGFVTMSMLSSCNESYTISTPKETGVTSTSPSLFASDVDISSSASSTASSTSLSEAEATIATFGQIGENYLLHSRYFLQGEVKNEETARLGWDGDMILCVKSGKVIEYSQSMDEADPIKILWNAYAADFTNPCILQLTMSLKNENAENRNGVRYQFGADMFRLGAFEDLKPENYQDSEFYTMIGNRMGAYEAAFDQHRDRDDYYCFELNPGETLDFTMEFLVERDYFTLDRPFLGIGPGRQFQVGILLDQLSRE